MDGEKQKMQPTSETELPVFASSKKRKQVSQKTEAVIEDESVDTVTTEKMHYTNTCTVKGIVAQIAAPRRNPPTGMKLGGWV